MKKKWLKFKGFFGFCKNRIKKIKIFNWRTDLKELRDNIRRLHEAIDNTKEGTDTYEKLQCELKTEYELLKKMKEAKHSVPPQIKVTLFVVGSIAFFAICLDQESPKALKLAQFVVKLFKLGG